jgi:RNA polymerase sigma factor (sigma-70 family)
MLVALVSHREDEEEERRALQGDSAAWGALYSRHERRLVVVLLARGMAVDEAKDVAQEAWAQLIKMAQAGRLQRLELPGLAVRQALFLDAKRRQTENRRSDLMYLMPVSPDDSGPEAALASRQQLGRAEVLLRDETELNRQIFHFAHADGLSHQEIGDRLGRSEQRVRQILCEIRARLRQAFEDDI